MRGGLGQSECGGGCCCQLNRACELFWLVLGDVAWLMRPWVLHPLLLTITSVTMAQQLDMLVLLLRQLGFDSQVSTFCLHIFLIIMGLCTHRVHHR